MSAVKLLPGMSDTFTVVNSCRDPEWQGGGMNALDVGAALDRDRAQWSAEAEERGFRIKNAIAASEILKASLVKEKDEVERLRAALTRIVDLRAPYKRDPQERAEAAVREAQQIAQTALDGGFR